MAGRQRRNPYLYTYFAQQNINVKRISMMTKKSQYLNSGSKVGQVQIPEQGIGMKKNI